MAPLATAYSGPPKLTLVRAFSEWRVDVPMLVLILLLGVWYLASARKVRQHGGTWATGRTFAFIVLGLGFWVIATMSWVGVYQGVLFYARATQTVLLVLMSPLFLAMGKPLTLLIEAYPGPGRRVEKAVRSRVAKVVTFPAITAFLIIAVPMSMYFTSWYTHFFTSGTVRELTYVILMAPGYLFFWTLLRVDPVPKEYPYGVGMWITAAEVVGDAFFGIAVIADQTMLGAAHYHAVGYPFGPSLATSQVLGGGIIWILGDSVGLPFLGAQLIQMMRADKREAEEIDAELDARDAARAAAKARNSSGAASSGTASAPVAANTMTERPAAADDNRDAEAMAASPATPETVTLETGEPDEADRPWWETDSRLTDRFKRA
jgi:cytochrome c oxidase assembly factor CtaG